MSKATAKSRLGLLLIRKGLLTEQQLDDALKIQLKTGQRLGEVLVEQGLLTERQLTKALKKQSRYRFVAAFMAMVLGPMSFGAFASQSSTSQTEEAAASQQINNYQGLKALDDDDLESIQGQGFQTPQEAFANLYQQAEGELNEDDELGPLDDIVTLLNPLSSMMDADISITGVKYHEGQPRQVIHEDGSIEMGLPAEIKQIAFNDLRVKGAPPSQTFGDVVINDIRFSKESSIRIRVRP